jgi:hypothetical protein
VLIRKGVKNSRQVTECNKYKRLCVESFDVWDECDQKAGLWRDGGYPGVTATTAQLLRSWIDPDRERKLFFCQVKGRTTEDVGEEPKPPIELEGAIQSLYSNYQKYHALWEQNADAEAKGLTPPVFIVVGNNTNVSKLIFNDISGWEPGARVRIGSWAR